MHRRNSNCCTRLKRSLNLKTPKYLQVEMWVEWIVNFFWKKKHFVQNQTSSSCHQFVSRFALFPIMFFFWPLASVCPCFSLQPDLSLSLFLSTYVPQGRCCQYDRIGLFLKGFLMTIFLTQMAQLFGDFWTIYKFISIYVSKTAIDTFLAIFWEILGVFLLHHLVTLSLPHSVFPCVCLCDSKTYFYLRPP